MRSAPTKGFTLMELVIVITVISLLTGAIIPTFSSYMKSQALKQLQEKIKSDIRSIQNRALTGSLSDQEINSNPVLYWGITFRANSADASPDYYYFISTAKPANAAGCPTPTTSTNIAAVQDKVILNTGMGIKSGGCIFFDFKNGGMSSLGFTDKVFFGYDGTMVTGNCRSIIWNQNGAVYNTNETSCT